MRAPATLILLLLLCTAGCGEERSYPALSLVGAPVLLGTSATTVAATDDELLVVTASGRSIRRVDLRSRAPVGHPISVPGGVSAVAVEGDSIWVVDRSRETLRRLDGRTGQVSSPTIQVPHGSRPAERMAVPTRNLSPAGCRHNRRRKHHAGALLPGRRR